MQKQVVPAHKTIYNTTPDAMAANYSVDTKRYDFPALCRSEIRTLMIKSAQNRTSYSKMFDSGLYVTVQNGEIRRATFPPKHWHPNDDSHSLRYFVIEHKQPNSQSYVHLRLVDGAIIVCCEQEIEALRFALDYIEHRRKDGDAAAAALSDKFCLAGEERRVCVTRYDGRYTVLAEMSYMHFKHCDNLA